MSATSIIALSFEQVGIGREKVGKYGSKLCLEQNSHTEVTQKAVVRLAYLLKGRHSTNEVEPTSSCKISRLVQRSVTAGVCDGQSDII